MSFYGTSRMIPLWPWRRRGRTASTAAAVASPSPPSPGQKSSGGYLPPSLPSIEQRKFSTCLLKLCPPAGALKHYYSQAEPSFTIQGGSPSASSQCLARTSSTSCCRSMNTWSNTSPFFYSSGWLVVEGVGVGVGLRGSSLILGVVRGHKELMCEALGDVVKLLNVSVLPMVQWHGPWPLDQGKKCSGSVGCFVFSCPLLPSLSPTAGSKLCSWLASAALGSFSDFLSVVSPPVLQDQLSELFFGAYYSFSAVLTAESADFDLSCGGSVLNDYSKHSIASSSQLKRSLSSHCQVKFYFLRAFVTLSLN